MPQYTELTIWKVVHFGNKVLDLYKMYLLNTLFSLPFLLQKNPQYVKYEI